MPRSLMEIGTVEELKSMSWSDFTCPPTLEEFQHILKLCNAFWVYEGEPSKEKPHALLTSGQHSNGFINLGAVLKEYEEFRMLLACSLLHLPLGVDAAIQQQVTGVVGSDSSATALAGDVATILGVCHIKMVKAEDERGKRQEWPEDQRPIKPTDLVLHIEELVTTASSTEAVRRGIREEFDYDVRYFPRIPCVIDRSYPELPRVGESEFVAMFRYKIRNFNPNECPYCEIGSEAVAPKANWAYLTLRRCGICGEPAHEGGSEPCAMLE